MNNQVKLLPLNTHKNIDQHLYFNIEQTGASVKWKNGYLGEGIVVAIVDTGIDQNNIRLNNYVIGGYNFTEDNHPSVYQDLHGHGTHTAGIVISMAPKVKLLVLKTLNKGGTGNIQALINAIYYAINDNGN